MSLEQVLAWDPEVILLGNFDLTTPADIYDDERWSSIDAVKNKRVYKVPLGGYRWDPPSQESPLMWQWMDEVINDGKPSPGLRTEVSSYYDFLYGSSPTSDQLDTILQNSANSSSRGYAKAD